MSPSRCRPHGPTTAMIYSLATDLAFSHHHALPPSCTSSIMHVLHHARPPSCTSSIMHVLHHALPPSSHRPRHQRPRRRQPRTSITAPIAKPTAESDTPPPQRSSPATSTIASPPSRKPSPLQVHVAQVALAEQYLAAVVPGPAYEATLQRLRSECLAVWRAGAAALRRHVPHGSAVRLASSHATKQRQRAARGSGRGFGRPLIRRSYLDGERRFGHGPCRHDGTAQGGGRLSLPQGEPPRSCSRPR